MESKSPKAMPPSYLNRLLPHDFFIGKRFEAGIVLTGTEVKALRNGNTVLAGSFIRLDRDGRPVWVNAYIPEYLQGKTDPHEPTRSRFLLLQQHEIHALRAALERKHESIFPVKLYFHHGLAKLEIAICKPKKLHDKRRELREKAEQREQARALKMR